MMIFFRLFLVLQLSTLLVFAKSELHKEYFILDANVMLSDIVKNPKEDILLYKINPTRHSKRVKTKEVLQKLQSYGYNDFFAKHAYTQFSQKSPIDTTKLKNELQKYYQKYYPDIKINDIVLKPNRYITSLPSKYTIGFSRNAELSRKGVFYIKTPQNKKIFFNYAIDAEISVYESKKDIKKGEELSFLNTRKKSIMLSKFRSMPIIKLPRAHYEAKHRIKKFTILTKRDISILFLVKRGNRINVTIQDEGVNINFLARALQNGRYGDTIAVMHNNKKKLYVIVTGKNRAKVK